jgi:hypothetical protein
MTKECFNLVASQCEDCSKQSESVGEEMWPLSHPRPEAKTRDKIFICPTTYSKSQGLYGSSPPAKKDIAGTASFFGMPTGSAWIMLETVQAFGNHIGAKKSTLSTVPQQD